MNSRKFKVTITLDITVDTDECDPEVFIMDEFFYNPAEFDYAVVVDEIH